MMLSQRVRIAILLLAASVPAFAQDGELPKPTRVTIKADAEPAEDVLKRLASQVPFSVQYKFADQNAEAGKRPVTIDLTDAPAFEAFVRVAQAAEQRLAINDYGVYLSAEKNTNRTPPMVSGAFFVQLMKSRLGYSVDYASPQTISRQLDFWITLQSEPSVIVLKPESLNVTKAIDNDGQPMMARITDEPMLIHSLMLPLANGLVRETSAPLKSFTVAGECVVWVAAKGKVVELPAVPLRVGETFDVGGAKATITHLTDDAQQSRVRIRVDPGTLPEAAAEAMAKNRFFKPVLRVGDKVLMTQASIARTPSGDLTLDLREGGRPLSPLPETLSISWTVPTDVRRVRVPFTFENVEVMP